MTRPHTTHHESCGCCEAERDALKAQVERIRYMYAAVLDAADAMRACGASGKIVSDLEPTGRENDPKWPGRGHPIVVPAKVLLAYDAARAALAEALKEGR